MMHMTKNVKAAFTVLFSAILLGAGLLLVNVADARIIDFPTEQKDSFATFSEDVRIVTADVAATCDSPASPVTVSAGKDRDDLTVSGAEFKEAGDKITLQCTVENANGSFAAGMHVTVHSSHPEYLEIIVENADGALMPGERRNVYITCRMIRVPDEPTEFSWIVHLQTEMIPEAQGS